MAGLTKSTWENLFEIWLLIPEKNPQDLLKAIYKEVLVLGFREGEDFIKKEFHFDLLIIDSSILAWQSGFVQRRKKL